MEVRNTSNGHHHHGTEDNSTGKDSSPFPPTPLFERLVTEEVQELKSCLRMIDSQQRRLNELERVHGDLEIRLEEESRGRTQLEATLEQREREWESRFKELERDRDHWKEIVKLEKSKNAKLIQQINRKDQDIHRMLSRKVRNDDRVDSLGYVVLLVLRVHLTCNCQYDKKGDSPSATHSIRNIRAIGGDRSTPQPPPTNEPPTSRNNSGEQLQQYKSPHEILAASGSMETVRIRNVQNLISEFFGM